MKIGLIGPIGVTDIGDIAILVETVDMLFEMVDNLELHIYELGCHVAASQLAESRSRWGEHNFVFHTDSEVENKWINRDFDCEDIAKGDGEYATVRNLDLLYCIPGAWLNFAWGWFLENAYMLPIEIAREAKVPIILGGNNIGPFKDVNPSLRFVKAAVLRGPEWLAHDGRTINLPDITFYANLGRPDPSRKPYVALCIHQRAKSDVIARYCRKVLRETDLDIRFVPMSLFNDADRKISLEIYDEIHGGSGFSERITIHKPSKNYHATVRLFAGAAHVISTRLHPLSYALAHGVPCVGIAHNGLYRKKLSGLFTILCQTQYIFGPDVELEHLWKASMYQAPPTCHERKNELKIAYRSFIKKAISES